MAAILRIVPSLLICAFATGEADRPSVLLTSSRLEGLRAECREAGWKKTVYEKGPRANALRWKAREITIPARSGHYHRFFCGDGARLEIPDDQRFKSDAYTCPACGKVYSGEPYDGGRRFMEHRWLVSACRDLALCAAMEEDAALAWKAAEILVKYADVYPGRHTAATKGGIMYQSLDEAVNMIQLAQAYDLLLSMDALAPEARKHIEADLFTECAEGLIAMGIGGNWGSWHLSSVGVMGIAIRNQRLIDYAVTSFKKQITEQLGSDGLWPESVHTYHFYPLRAFIYFAEACANTGTDLYNWRSDNGKGLRDMFTAPLSYMYPDTRLPAINDGWFDSFLPAVQYEAAYYRYGLPEFARALQACYRRAPRGMAGPEARSPQTEPWALILGGALPEEEKRPDFKSINFDHIGIAVLRNEKPEDELFMTFDYGPYLGHGQHDVMGVTLYGGGALRAADYGTPGYGSAILDWYRSTAGHNTIVVDGKNQQRNRKGRLDVFVDTPECKAARAESSEVYPGITWSRLVVVTDGHALIEDRLSSASEHQYDWFFHSEGGDFTLAGGEAFAEVEAGELNPFVRDVRAAEVADGVSAQWGMAGKGGLKLQLFYGGTARIFTGVCPAETGARRVPLITARCTGKSCRFLGVLSLVKPGTESPEVTAWDNEHIEIVTGKSMQRFTTGAAFHMDSGSVTAP